MKLRNASTRRLFTSETVQLGAGEKYQLPGKARWISFLAASADTLAIAYGAGDFQPLPKGLILDLVEDGESELPDEVIVRNTGGAPVTVTIARGLSKIQDNRLVFTNLTPLAVELVDAGGTPVPLPAALGGAGGLKVEVENTVPVAAGAKDMTNFDSTSFGNAPGTYVIAAAGVNVNGIEVAGICAAFKDVGLVRLLAGTKAVWAAAGEGSSSNSMRSDQPLRIPAGVALSVVIDGDTVNARGYVTWKAL